MRTLSRRSLLGSAAVISIAGGVSAVLAQGAGTPPASPEASPSASPGASPVASPMAGGEPIEVHLLDTFRFEPAEFDAQVGGTIHLVNKGFLEHDFAVDDWGGVLSPILLAGQTADVVIPADAEVGKVYEFYCSVAGHKQGGMVGKVTITG